MKKKNTRNKMYLSETIYPKIIKNILTQITKNQPKKSLNTSENNANLYTAHQKINSFQKTIKK